MLGAWLLTDKLEASVITILTSAQQCNPSYVRSFLPIQDLDPEVKEILDQIELFTYNLDKGFFHWEYGGGLDSGTFPKVLKPNSLDAFKIGLNKTSPPRLMKLKACLLGVFRCQDTIRHTTCPTRNNC